MSSALPYWDPSAPEPERRPLCRRRFLGLLGLAGAGWVATREGDTLQRGFVALQDYCAKLEFPRVADGPEPSAAAYAAFLAALGLKHLPTSVVLAPHRNRHGSVRNSFPPERLWDNIAPTLRVVDRLAGELGERVQINSAYRSPAYNGTCPGAVKWSQHLQNRAIDLSFESSPATVAELARKLRDRGLFRGGVGEYANFVHIDTRGRNADW